jgi:hypothetical protein
MLTQVEFNAERTGLPAEAIWPPRTAAHCPRRW